jgi:membrane fusion protein, multidrug efflux system
MRNEMEGIEMTLRYRRAVLILIPVLIASACGKAGTQAARAVPVTVTIVQAGQITEEVYAPSRLEGAEEALIYPALGGRVLEVLVSEGDSVTSGDRLVRLATDTQISAGASAAQAGVAAARANETNASRTLERLQSLFEAGGVSQQELDGATAMYETARAGLQQAYAGAMQAGSVADNSFITAPFDGRVGRIWAREGNAVGGGPVISISNSSGLVARVLLPERYLPLLTPGLPAYVSITAYDGESFPGLVTAASRSVDPVSGLVPVEISFDNAEGRISPGMTGRVAVAVDTHEGALALPEIAFRRTAEGLDLVVARSGIARVVPVTAGISSRGMVEVTSGLSAGDSVIVEGQFRIADGDSVSISGTR